MNKSDFFGDHNNDIVFQNSDGAIALWDMSGASILGAGVVAVNPWADLGRRGHSWRLSRYTWFRLLHRCRGECLHNSRR